MTLPIVAVVALFAFLLAATASQHRRHASQTDARLCRGCGTNHPPFAHFCRRCGRSLAGKVEGATRA